MEANSIKTVQDLTTALGLGETFEYLYFWGHTGKGMGRHVFSQWYQSEFKEHGLVFQSAEHYMMYKKALLFSDNEIAVEILQAKDPAKAKALGRKIRSFNESVWVAHRFEIVVQGSVLKFGAKPELRDFLLNTKSKVLVEASPPDKIWGIGMDATAAKKVEPFNWKGLNLLGFALMEARGELQSLNATG